MDTRRLLPLVAVLGLLALAPPAPASHDVTPYNRYTLLDETTLQPLDVNIRAYMLLPQSLRDRSRNRGPVLRFGPIGSCRFNMSIPADVDARDSSESASQRVARLLPARSDYIYAQGTRNTAAWRVVRLRGSANVRAIWVLPVNLRTGFAFDAPRTPAWLEIRGIANEHADECHSGGPRYVGDVLADAFGAMSATAFSTNLPRTPLPPAPSG
jgi:hypothetical protein